VCECDCSVCERERARARARVRERGERGDTRTGRCVNECVSEGGERENRPHRPRRSGKGGCVFVCVVERQRRHGHREEQEGKRERVSE
jgi:hypothetical protein